MPPCFITLEGGEGAGKSTQARLLAEALERVGIPTLTTREPGGSPGAEAIRELLVRGAVDRWSAETESLLFMTARFDHLHHTILPALESGKWVICDRFFDSTLVYQGIAKGVDADWLRLLYRTLYGDCAPDLTLLLDLPPELGLARAGARAGGETRFEAMGLAFHERIRDGFLARAKEEPSRIAVIDATGDAQSVHRAVMEAVRQKFPLLRGGDGE